MASYVYLGLLGSLDNFSNLFRYISYTDLLRPLINLTALNSNCFGTIFLQQCSEKFVVLDIKNHPIFSKWENMTAQAPFFILYNYFGYLGIFLSFFLLILILKKIAGHRNRGFIFFNVLIQMFLQGFLLGPLFLWVLSLREEKK